MLIYEDSGIGSKQSCPLVLAQICIQPTKIRSLEAKPGHKPVPGLQVLRSNSLRSELGVLQSQDDQQPFSQIRSSPNSLPGKLEIRGKDLVHMVAQYFSDSVFLLDKWVTDVPSLF